MSAEITNKGRMHKEEVDLPSGKKSLLSGERKDSVRKGSEGRVV